MVATAKVTVGLTFHSTWADSNPLWRVTKPRGRNTWECVISDESADYAGTRRVFGGEEILRSVAHDQLWQNIADDHTAWWQSQEVGATVHYHYGFGQYVRGVIVADDSEGGQKKMRCTAMVGNWKAYDLPHIDAAGRLAEGYMVRRIREGALMHPNYSNMVEAVGPRQGHPDPRGMPAIDLTPPTATPEQIEAGRLSVIHEQVLGVLNLGGIDEPDPQQPYSTTLRIALLRARKLLNNTDIGADSETQK